MRANPGKDRHAANSGKEFNLYYAPGYRIKVNGEDIVKTYLAEVTSLTLEDTLEGASRFSFVVNDPGSRRVDQGLFDPGKTVEVEIGYAGKLSPMILGKIDLLRPGFPAQGTPRLEVSGQDSSSKSSRTRKRRSLKDNVLTLKYGSSLLSFELNLNVPISGKQTLPRSSLTDQFEGLILGRGCSIGLPDLRAGISVELIGLGSKFSGSYYVERTTHTISESGYSTNFEAIKNNK